MFKSLDMDNMQKTANDRRAQSPVPRSLTFTLALAFIALSLMTLLISSGLQMLFHIESQQAVIASRQQTIARNAGITVSSFIQEKFRVLETSIKLSDPAMASEQEQRRMLAGLLGLQPAFRQLILLNASGQERARISRLSRMASGTISAQLVQDVAAKTRQGQKYISPVNIDPVTGEPMIYIAVPVESVFGDYQGALAVEVNLKFMWDLVDRLKVGKTGVAYVVDGRGNLIAFNDIGRVLKGENVGHLKAVREFILDPATSHALGVNIYSGIMGARVVGTYVPLGTPDWAVVTEMPLAEAYREFIGNVAISAVATLILAVLAGLMGAVMAKRLAAPLIHLIGTATRITNGEIDLRAAVVGPLEVAGLATAFNSMTARLRQTLAGLEQRVADRTAQLSNEVAEHKQAKVALETAQRQLIDTSREAGMAEVATNVLHNVGNVLNSVNVSAAVLMESLRKSKCSNLAKIATLLREHASDLAGFLTADPRGRQLPDYLIDLSQFLAEERNTLLAELGSLIKNIEHIKDIVSMQQNYASASGLKESVSLRDLVEDAIQLNNAALIRHDVQIAREYAEIPKVLTEKHRVVQILVNLIRNAKYALDEGAPAEKFLTLRINGDGSRKVRIEVADNGCGISPEVMPHIFEHGFTTRAGGHGFGLHGSVLAARQLGGTLDAHSEGRGRGTTFILELPLGLDTDEKENHDNRQAK